MAFLDSSLERFDGFDQLLVGHGLQLIVCQACFIAKSVLDALLFAEGDLDGAIRLAWAVVNDEWLRARIYTYALLLAF